MCLIDKTIDDFKKIYEKSQKIDNANNANRIDQIDSDNKSMLRNIQDWRKTKMNKEEVKKVVKKAVVLIAASVACMSLFACGGKTETKMEYPSISIDQDVNTGNDSKVKVTEVVVKPTEIKETKKYVEETTKPVETTEPAPTQSAEEMAAELNSLLINSPENQKTGTDANGHPYLQKGQEYTFKDNGMGEPVEAPYGMKTKVTNPNTGVKYKYLSTGKWIVDTSEQDAEEARLRKEGYVRNSDGEWVQGRKMTEEELNKYAKMFSDSFK